MRGVRSFGTDMKSGPNFTPPEFQAKIFTPSISSNFNSFSKKKHKKSENGDIYTAGKNFTLPPAVTAWTNSTSAMIMIMIVLFYHRGQRWICQCRHCRRQCKIFASGVNFSIFPLKLLKLGEIDGVKFLA